MERNIITTDFLKPSNESQSNIKIKDNYINDAIKVMDYNDIESYKDTKKLEDLDIHHISKEDLQEHYTSGMVETLEEFESITNKNNSSKKFQKNASLNSLSILRDYSNLNVHLSNDEGNVGTVSLNTSESSKRFASDSYSYLSSPESYKVVYFPIDSNFKENVRYLSYTSLMYDSYFFYDNEKNKAILTENFSEEDNGVDTLVFDYTRFDHLEFYSRRYRRFALNMFDCNNEGDDFTCLGDLWGKRTQGREALMIELLHNYLNKHTQMENEKNNNVFESPYSIIKPNGLSIKEPIKDDDHYEDIEFEIPQGYEFDNNEDDDDIEDDEETIELMDVYDDDYTTLYNRALNSIPGFDDMSSTRQNEIIDIFRDNLVE